MLVSERVGERVGFGWAIELSGAKDAFNAVYVDDDVPTQTPDLNAWRPVLQERERATSAAEAESWKNAMSASKAKSAGASASSSTNILSGWFS